MKRLWLLLAAALAASPAAAASRCDEKCLLTLADRTMVAVAAKKPNDLPWSKNVRFTENGVPINIPDGLWGSTGEGPHKKVLAVADARTGNVVWLGTVFDHDQPAFGAMRLKADADGKIAEIEFTIARKANPGPYGEAATFALDPDFTRQLPARDRRSRARLVDLADGYLATKQQNNGNLFIAFTPGCELRVNGAAGTDIAQGCEDQFRVGAYAPVERIRDRRFPIVDEERGLVVVLSQQDLPVRETSFRTTDGRVHEIKDQFPMTRGVIEVLKIEGDRIARSEAISVYQPYRMASPWRDQSNID